MTTVSTIAIFILNLIDCKEQIITLIVLNNQVSCCNAKTDSYYKTHCYFQSGKALVNFRDDRNFV